MRFTNFHRTSGAIAAVAALMGTAAINSAAQAAPLAITEVVLEGLNNPRSVVVSQDGALWVVEAGSGGTGTSIVNDNGETVSFGLSGRVTMTVGGVTTVVAEGLPSLASAPGFAATGAHDVAFAPDGTPHVLFGFGSDPADRTAFAGETNGDVFGQLVAIDGGSLIPVADIAAAEGANPDGGGINSNPYGVAATPDGFAVTDAGANTVLDVASDGTVSVRTVLPPSANPLPFGPPVYEAVPTGIVSSSDGDVIVSELTGFPFPPGGATLYSVGSDGIASEFAEGFTNVIDLALGPDGIVLALELDSDSLIGPDAIGSLYAIDDLGVKTLLYSGLLNPTSVAVGGDGTIYITENGLSPDGGRLLALSEVPVPAALPLMACGLASIMAIGRRRRRT
jgi:hypothetical protein